MAGLQWLRSRAHVVIPTAVVATAIITLAITVAHPPRIFFDEVYYVNDARDFLEFGVESGFVVHPPLGKMLIAAGISLFGDTPFGWRIIGALLGVAGAGLVHAIGRRLGLRRSAAGLAGLALALDGVWISQSHTAMLDIHLGFFVVLGTWLLVRDRDHLRAVDAHALEQGSRTPTEDGHVFGTTHPVRLEQLPKAHRWWLVGAGVAFGAAVAVKWSGALALVAAGVVVVAWEVGRRHGLLGRRRRSPWRLAGLVTVFGLVAVATYLVTWTPWLVAFDNTWVASNRCAPHGELDCDGPLGRAEALVVFHEEMIEFHLDLDAEHAYRSPATGWPIQHRPVVFYYETCSVDRSNRVEKTDDDGTVTVPEPCSVPRGSAAEIISLGNPAVWWTTLALVPLLGAALRRRERGVWLVAAFILFQFVAWMGPSRPVFNFYTVPLVPFVVLALAIAVDHVASLRRAWRTELVGLVTAAVVGGPVVLAATTGLAPIDQAAAWYLMGLAGLAGGWVAARPQAGTPDGQSTPDTAPADPTRVDPVETTTERDTVTPPSGVARWWWAHPEPGDNVHHLWPSVVMAIAIVAVGLWFLPLWWGITLPEGIVRAHWWLPSWI